MVSIIAELIIKTTNKLIYKITETLDCPITLPFCSRAMMRWTSLKLDGLELNSSGLIGPISESSASSMIIRSKRTYGWNGLNAIGDLLFTVTSSNSFFLRSESFGVGARLCRVLLLVRGVVSI